MFEAVQSCIQFTASQLFAWLGRLQFELGSEEVSGCGIANFPLFFHIINTITIMVIVNRSFHHCLYDEQVMLY